MRFKFGLRLAPSDGSGLAYSLDGANAGEKFEARSGSNPLRLKAARTDAEGAWRPLVFNSRVKADFEQIALEKIEIAPRGSDGAKSSGRKLAEVRLGEDIKLTSELSATRFDLDSSPEPRCAG